MYQRVNIVRIHTLLVAGFIISFSSIYAQREPQNVYRVTVKSRYVLENGQRTKDYFAIGQHIFDSLGRLHTEIDYDWETHYPNNYRWHYFSGKTKTKTDFFEKEKLARIEEYKVNEKGNVKEVSVKTVTPADTSFALKVEYSYNPDGTIQKAVGYNSKGKKGFTCKYMYDARGTEINRKVKGKKAIPLDSILFLARVPLYDSAGRVAEETLTVEKVGKGKTTIKQKFLYDLNGNITHFQKFDGNGNLVLRKEYTYRKDNRIQQMKKFDSNDSLIDWLAWRYEIYKTNDRRQRVLE